MNFSPGPVTTHLYRHLMTCVVLVVLLVVIALPSAVGAQAGVVPQGWFKMGNTPQDYDVGTDEAVKRSGAASAYVRHRVPMPRGFGTLMQTFTAESYRGKRVRLSGYLRGEKIRRAGGVWMRIDGPDPQKPLRFDDTQRRVTPNSEWVRIDIVLDVPPEAMSINFGLLLEGEGQVWLDDVVFQEVTRDVPTTDRAGRPQLPQGPINLDFERKPPRPTTDGE